MGTMIERLKEAMDAADIGVGDLAEKIGCKQPYMSRIYNGNVGIGKYLKPIADALGVDPEWLRRGPPKESHPSEPIVVGVIGEIAGEAWAGDAREVERVQVSIPDGCIAVRINGHSGGTVAMDGQKVLLHPETKKPKSSIPVVVFTKDGRSYFKRWFPMHGSDWIILQSIDSMYPPVLLKKDDIKEVRVVWSTIWDRS